MSILTSLRRLAATLTLHAFDLALRVLVRFTDRRKAAAAADHPRLYNHNGRSEL